MVEGVRSCLRLRALLFVELDGVSSVSSIRFCADAFRASCCAPKAG